MTQRFHPQRMALAAAVCSTLVLGALPAAARGAPVSPVATEVRASPEVSASSAAQTRAKHESDLERYREREQANPEAAEFRGGDIIVISASTTAVILAIILLIVLL